MYITIFIMFMMIGTILAMFDTMFPGLLFPFVAMMVRWMGVILMWTGAMVLFGRVVQTTAISLVKQADNRKTILIHMGSSSAKLMETAKSELNTLKNPRRRMRFKDMGGGIRISGHDVQLSSETCNATWPVWLVDLIDRYRSKYGVEDEGQLRKLEEQLKSIKTHYDLDKIDLLKPVMNDPKRKSVLMSMPIEDIRLLKERCYDGVTRDAKSYRDFSEHSSPYDNESIISRTLAHRAEQRTSYRFAGGVDWGKVVIPVVILLLIGAIAYQIFGS